MLAVVVSNPLAWSRSEVASVVVCHSTSCPSSFTVFSANGLVEIPSQTVVDVVRNVTVLYFFAEVGPLGMETYFIQRAGRAQQSRARPRDLARGPTNISNGYVLIEMNENGQPTYWTDLKTGLRTAWRVDLLHYTERLPPPSGNIFLGGNVYTFVPDGASPSSLFDRASRVILTADGPLVWQIDVVLNTDVCTGSCFHTLRLTTPGSGDPLSSSLVYLQPLLGPLQYHPSYSGSISMRVSTDIASGATFTTDMNHHLRYQRTFNLSAGLQGNMYPIVGGIGLTGL